VFPDLFKAGNLAGISVGQPLRLQDDVLGFFNANQTNYEAFYRFQVSDNIAISLVFQAITDPGNIKGNTILTGTLRTVFSF
jgi:Carbohydrate-selective porin, OprB family